MNIHFWTHPLPVQLCHGPLYLSLDPRYAHDVRTFTKEGPLVLTRLRTRISRTQPDIYDVGGAGNVWFI